MKILSGATFLLGAVLLGTTAFASNVPANTVLPTNLWTVLGSNPLPSLTPVSVLATGTFTLPSLHPTSGFYILQVLADSTGHLVFGYQIELNGDPPNPSNGALEIISVGDWPDAVSVDARQFASASGQVAASGVNRLGGVISMYFQAPLLKNSQTSFGLLLYTNATQFTTNTTGLLAGAGTTITGFAPLAPTPEPMTLSLLGVGLAGLGVVRKRLLG